jgi:hypothetical protein
MFRANGNLVVQIHDMPLVNCKEPACSQQVEVSCTKVVALFRTKIFLENVKLELPLGSALYAETDQHLVKITQKIKGLALEDETTLFSHLMENKGLVNVSGGLNKTVVLTLQCALKHSHKDESQCD